ncbi:MAG: histidine phosphatase family protein [Bacillota bacterium]|jgi:alpha-ribazole phosphatase|nr:histidine phosphatase family protein [Bacillota bacterium]HOC05741.1 histidine phosphatase family protein [Bacillota bacterium]HPZ21438.1 histidine phosphatase family protein [Bacillota bacterium]HQD19299.1 histidine phosphatase family protein [Bacillota bacterium]
MAQLLLIRHGETVWNREGRFQGAIDVPLSEKGKAEARQLGAYLRDKPLKAIYSSHLSRALETAQAVARHHHLPVQVVEGLGEINMGEWAGHSWEEIWEKWPELGRQWYNSPPESPPPPGGEYYPDFQARAMEALEEIAAAHASTDLLAVVTHGGVIRAVINKLLGISWGTRGRFFIKNCSITPMRWQSRGLVVVEGFNDVCHMQYPVR